MKLKIKILNFLVISSLLAAVILVTYTAVNKNTEELDRPDNSSSKYCNLASCENSIHPMCHYGVSKVAKIS